MGYGTAWHRAALRRVGSCPEHRQSYAPVRPGRRPARGGKIRLRPRPPDSSCRSRRSSPPARSPSSVLRATEPNSATQS
jgi:hypothetical protein